MAELDESSGTWWKTVAQMKRFHCQMWRQPSSARSWAHLKSKAIASLICLDRVEPWCSWAELQVIDYCRRDAQQHWNVWAHIVIQLRNTSNWFWFRILQYKRVSFHPRSDILSGITRTIRLKKFRSPWRVSLQCTARHRHNSCFISPHWKVRTWLNAVSLNGTTSAPKSDHCSTAELRDFSLSVQCWLSSSCEFPGMWILNRRLGWRSFDSYLWT